MQRLILSIYIFVMLFSASTLYAEELKIATGNTIIKRILDPVKSAFFEKTGIDLKIHYYDPLPALAELEKGTVDAAGASLQLEYWLELGRKSGLPVKESGTYNSFVPVVEKTMIVVNGANRVTALSSEQLKGIFTGRITDWKEVGGDEAPILVVWPTLSSGALIVFKADILDNEPLTKTVYDVESMADTSEAIIATPQAIGIVSGTAAEKGLKEVAPAIERPLTLVYKGKPAPALQKLLDFLKGEGKQYIK